MMAKLNLGLKQVQTLKLSPQMQQAMKLLQMNHLELEQAIQSELQNNPVLEEYFEPAGQNEFENPVPKFDEQSDSDQDESFDWRSFREDEYWQRKKIAADFRYTEDDIVNYENILSKGSSLKEHLAWQIRMAGLSEDELMIADFLIESINEDGYLIDTLENLQEEFLKLHTREKADNQLSQRFSLDTFKKVLEQIQELDPPGVGARNLQECLILQLKYLGEDTADMIELVNQHLGLLEKKQYQQIATLMNKPLQEVLEMAQIIQALDPKPGRMYTDELPHYVVPDVFVEKVGDDVYIYLNDENIPNLRISPYFKTMLETQSFDPQTKAFIKEKMNSALWLIKNLNQRQKTIYRVAQVIFRIQRDFLDHGPGALKPMTLKDVASELGIHESTVSRVTSHKYVHTPFGVFELKYFFKGGLAHRGHGSVSVQAVKEMIKEIIERENPRFPLSDAEIAEILKRQGIEIARRTVAKYREELKILPSSARKR